MWLLTITCLGSVFALLGPKPSFRGSILHHDPVYKHTFYNNNSKNDHAYVGLTIYGLSSVESRFEHRGHISVVLLTTILHYLVALYLLHMGELRVSSNTSNLYQERYTVIISILLYKPFH